MVTVLAHGCWDLLHPGHLEHLRQARNMGDRLIVSITADEYIAKGPGRPVFSQDQRAAMLAALRCVDEVFICSAPSGTPAIEHFKPDIYVKGAEYADRPSKKNGNLLHEKKAVEKYGGRIVFTDSVTLSSTNFLNTMNGRPIQRIPQEIYAWLDKAKAVTMHLLGEPIIDEYIYVYPEAKSPKENVITYRQLGSQQFSGGVLAIQKHMAGLCTAIGSDSLQTIAPIIKRRYVTRPFYAKVFSTVNEHEIGPYYVPDSLPCPLLVADYGHGMIRGKIRTKQIAERTDYLALMVQSNSLNWGYNLLTKWPRADYFVIDEPEIRLARSDRWTPVEDLLAEEYIRLHARIGAVTLGHDGCIIYDGKEIIKIPALASKITDRLGAGDAFLAWTAPLAYLNAPIDIIGFVGNVAGGIQVGTVGNEKPVDRQAVNQWVKGLLE